MHNKQKILRLLSYYKPYRVMFALDMTCALMSALIQLYIPIGIRTITGELIESGLADAAPQIYRTGALLAGLACLGAAMFFVVDYVGHAMGAKMERDIRREVFHHLQTLGHSFYDSRRTGELMSRITGDSQSMAEFCHHAPEDWVIQGFRFIGAIIVLLLLDWRLALIVAAFVPIIAIFTILSNSRMRRAIKLSAERIADVNQRVEDTLSGIRVVKANSGEATEQHRFDEANELFLGSRKKWYFVEAIAYGGTELLINILPIVIAVAGGVMIIGGSGNLPNLLVFLMYANYLTQPMNKLMWMTEQFQTGFVSFERLTELLDTKPDIVDAPGAKLMPEIAGDVEFENVSFRYADGDEDVLSNVSFKVPAGSHVAIVGTSGIGKTTLCSLIPRFYEPTGGRILIDGIDTRCVTIESLRRQIGVVTQEGYMFQGTIESNIKYSKPDAPEQLFKKIAGLANVAGFAERFKRGYQTEVGQRGMRLSGGQRQRIEIARAMLKGARLFILDEATSSLDNNSERQVTAAMQNLTRGHTTFTIAHRLSTVRNADQIMVLTQSGVAERGTHDELMALGGTYSKMYEGGL